MQQNTMEQPHYGNVYGSIVTIILFFISHFTLSDGAALAAIFAGVTTGGYNVYKFYKDRKNQSHDRISKEDNEQRHT
jgi:hypothetical protein